MEMDGRGWVGTTDNAAAAATRLPFTPLAHPLPNKNQHNAAATTTAILLPRSTHKQINTTPPPRPPPQLVERDVERLGERGIRSLAVAKTNASGGWEMAGLLTFLDPPRPDTKQTIDRAREYGVEVKMITGDHLLIAKETARQLGMGTDIKDSSMLPKLDADGKAPPDLMDHFEYVEATAGFAGVFPEHKFLIVEVLRRGGYKVRPSVHPSVRQAGRQADRGCIALGDWLARVCPAGAALHCTDEGWMG